MAKHGVVANSKKSKKHRQFDSARSVVVKIFLGSDSFSQLYCVKALRGTVSWDT
jgi:hypothetical protein